MTLFKIVSVVIPVWMLTSAVYGAPDIQQGMFEYSPDKACGITSETKMREMVRKRLCEKFAHSEKITEAVREQVIKEVLSQGCPVTDAGRQIGDLERSIYIIRYDFKTICSMLK